jgi:hypothetical protein
MAGDIRTHVPWGKCDAECREAAVDIFILALRVVNRGKTIAQEERLETKVSQGRAALIGAEVRTGIGLEY